VIEGCQKLHSQSLAALIALYHWVIEMRRELRVSFRKLGCLLKARGLRGRYRVPLWEVALGLVLY